MVAAGIFGGCFGNTSMLRHFKGLICGLPPGYGRDIYGLTYRKAYELPDCTRKEL